MEPFLVDLTPLSDRSANRVPADTEEIFNRIFKGSMPALISGQNSNSQIFYSSYLFTYIERDIRELSDSIDPLKFLKFITAVAARCGQMLNIADIPRDADINQKQAKDWLGILETLESGAMNGAILENYVVAEIRKTYLNCGKEPFMYYYRDKDAKEIDIILEHDGVLNPLEIKKSSNPGSELTGVFHLLDNSSTPRSNDAILCMKPQLSAIDRENYIVPIWMI